MLVSMTGFAALSGSAEGYSWHWELRSVNGKGLDIRLRLPDWLAALEPELRKALGVAAARGNVTLGLRIACEAGEGSLEINAAALDRVLDAIVAIETRAGETGLNLTPASAADVLGARGVLDVAQNSGASEALLDALRADIAPLCASFKQMRTQEGTALLGVLTRQLSDVADLTAQAKALLGPREAAMRETLRAGLTKVLAEHAELDEARLAQEIAVLAVKSDVAEEIDRLEAHIKAAEALLTSDAPVGRKFDFLMQEFNREANTLCSKSQNADLTEVGLALKVLIDQMREQVQNVE